VTNTQIPLAEYLRPTTIEEVIGQEQLLAQDKPLRLAIESGKLPSMILWGPPGVGKTTLAHVISKTCDFNFISQSAVLSGVKEIRESIEIAKLNLEHHQKRTILFVDEVHRFNKSQQDAFLPHIESGLITFIGATTENPSFEVNKALLSRCQVYTLKALDDEALKKIIDRVITKQSNLNIEETAKENLLLFSSGDARRLINLLEMAIDQITLQKESAITNEIIKKIISEKNETF
jgi:putative ATPase